MALIGFRAPALPIPPVEYNRQQFDELTRALRVYFNQLDSLTPNQANSYRADQFILNTTGTVAPTKGTLSWNTTDATADLGMEYGVVQQIGEELYARVGNTTGSTIPNGTVVGFAGATSNALLVAPYLADGSQPSLYILGVMTHDLPDSGDKGYCTTWGFVRDVDTSAFNQGDVLYANPTVAGAFTNIKPTAPNNVIPLAACIVSDATNGVIFVRPTIEQVQYYGTFEKTDNQSAAVINTGYPITFNLTQLSNGVTIGTPASRIVVPQSGFYQFDASFELTSGNASAKNFRLWFRKNGTDITDSSRITTNDINSGYQTFSTARTISLSANDYVELVFSVTDTAMSLVSTPATAWAPGAPACILSVTQVQL